jgi:hypothetical protein
MTNYEIVLLWAVVLLISSLLVGFSAVTNRTSLTSALVLFVLGGFSLYYANSISFGGSLSEDIPRAIYKLYAKLMH